MRTKRFPQRDIDPDPRYGSHTVAKLINRSMNDGKKAAAQKQVYAALDILKEEIGENPVDLLDAIIEMVEPDMEVRSRRVGGAAYQVPMPVKKRRARSLAIRWIVVEANKRPNRDYHTYAEKLAAELLAAREEQGGAISRRDASHRMAESNKAFAHFRW